MSINIWNKLLALYVVFLFQKAYKWKKADKFNQKYLIKMIKQI